MSQIIKGAKILVVDDEKTYLNVLSSYLDSMEAEVFLAQNGYAALEIVKNKKPDIILLDIMMPEINGYEICKKLKEKEETRDIPVIFLSALSATTDILKGFDAGGVDYIIKPVHYQEAIARITNHLKIRYMEQALRHRLRLEELATSISAGFINFNHSEFDSKINDSLKTMGKFFSVDRSYIYLFSDDLSEIKGTYEWYNEEITSKSQILTDLSISPSGWIMEKFKKFEILSISSPNDLPNEAKAEKKILEKENIQSILLIPMVCNNILAGYSGLASIKTSIKWKEEDIKILKLLGEIFINIFKEKWADEERRKMEEQLRQAEKFESLAIMAGGIAHNFNNILSGSLGYAELAIINLSEDSTARKTIQKVITSLGRAKDITRQILAYTGGDKFIINMEKVNISRIVREMSELIEMSVNKKYIIKYELTDKLPAIKGDVSQLSQILINLINNASEAIDGKKGTITVKTGQMECDEIYLKDSLFGQEQLPGLYVYMEVEDTGCGIEEELKYKIFDPFFSTKFTGRGLGLAAVQGIVRSHKGTIKVTSKQGKGTEIKVLFPAQIEQ
jgi:signal transduction histidine kinase/DNA-binding NarL/FixJ family response regulator